MSTAQPQRKKLIEVALPLEAINEASIEEKNNPFLKGHPRSIHHWWARRPLAACRAVLFASLVDDPGNDLPEEEARVKREELFRLIERLVRWDNLNDEKLLSAARAEIRKSMDGRLPVVLDPFAGGGSIPVEAQRLGLKTQANDLNPVAVLINKALVEVPSKYFASQPVHPSVTNSLFGKSWPRYTGLAEDIRQYGKWMRDEAERRIGYLYPKDSHGEIIIWIWTRTVKCPNPACAYQAPLVRSFVLSNKKGKRVWIVPVVDKGHRKVTFRVESRQGQPPDGTVSKKGVRCLVCETPIPFDYIRTEGKEGRIGQRLMAMIAKAERGRTYLSPSNEQEEAARQASPAWEPDSDLPAQALGFRIQAYGMKKHRDLFTPRQRVALSTFTDLIAEVRDKIEADSRGDLSYADAVCTYLALAIGKVLPYWSALSSWHSSGEQMQSVFARQAISMNWDFAECNPFSSVSVNFYGSVSAVATVVENLPDPVEGLATQTDAAAGVFPVEVLVSTDPPYYDNIGYADLSDFFYVWLRRSLGKVYPDLFSTLLTPKTQEMIANPYQHHGDMGKAEEHFLNNLEATFAHITNNAAPEFPITVFYAFKQAEADEQADGEVTVASTGWETILQAIVRSGLQITGTWPMRTEGQSRARNRGGFNALASSIVLVCRPRPEKAALATRRDFLNALKRELPDALKKLQHGNIAPVDLAQAAIGPGIAVFSRYAKVVESDGSMMRVRTALQLINQALDEVLAEQESEYDAETRWAVAWFEQMGMSEGAYGTAETLSKAKNTSVSGMDEAGVTISRAGKVRLLRRDELPGDWDPTTDRRITTWEVTQHLIRALDTGGEQAAATLLAQVGGMGDVARDLAYRLYTTSERKGWTQEALAYNSLVVAWPEISRLAKTPTAGTTGTLFG